MPEAKIGPKTALNINKKQVDDKAGKVERLEEVVVKQEVRFEST